jgi:hypothetical protein
MPPERAMGIEPKSEVWEAGNISVPLTVGHAVSQRLVKEAKAFPSQLIFK